MSQAKNTPFRVLLVDDFELVRVMLRNALKALGFTDISEAGDGKSALHKIREAYAEGSGFDLVFCDWNMPEMDGMELLQLCRKFPEFENLPFIMVTAEADQKQVFKALSNGATDYIVKPISPEILERKVLKILRKVQTGVA